MNHCADCRYWQPFKEREGSPSSDFYAVERNRLGLCGRILSKHRYDAEDIDDVAQETIAVVEDLSDACGLRTGPTFGCALFEEKVKAK